MTKQLSRLVAALACAMCLPLAGHATDYYDLYMTTTDGSVVRLDYANLRSLTFQRTTVDGKATIVMNVNTAAGVAATYNMANTDFISFMDVTTGIEDAVADEAEAPLSVVDGEVVANERGEAAVYGIDGRKLRAAKVEEGDKVSLSDLSAGTYIITLNGHSLKKAVR